MENDIIIFFVYVTPLSDCRIYNKQKIFSDACTVDCAAVSTLHCASVVQVGGGWKKVKGKSYREDPLKCNRKDGTKQSYHSRSAFKQMVNKLLQNGFSHKQYKYSFQLTHPESMQESNFEIYSKCLRSLKLIHILPFPDFVNASMQFLW